ncbi:plasmid replication initiator protein [Micromonospora sp. NBC_00898]|uniref:replication initiator n=1 Tax=Micromonospora sp. NBC_00898 TaxID=2975981 RepID=UPI00386A9078|nr:plasmid replication initiator protein [Micromonospora sp. NBC_00898]
MAADPTAVVPDQAHPSGPGHRPHPATGSSGSFVGRDESAFQRATTPDYFGWLEHVRSAAGCSHPIRLSGEVATVDRATGQLLASVSTADLPDGEIYKPCGNRRHAVCPSCARTYQRDAYQLVKAGLAGGKGIPATVAQHPAVFGTFTASSFGPVHTQRSDRAGRPIPCRPRRHADLCPHGVDLRCHQRHTDDDPTLGTPLCLDCYDYDGQAVWNHSAPELWRRTTIAITRHVHARARALGLPWVQQVTDSGRVRLVPPVKVSFGKVAEMQRRGVVHYHAVIRLDGVDPHDPNAVIPPPAALGVDDLVAAVQHAAVVAFTTRPHPVQPAGWHITWGDPGKGLDVQPVNADGDITDGKVAGYLAKYATKSTETTGHVSRRLDSDTIDLYANHQGTHPERLIDACWTLGGHRDWQQLRRWAHMLGFGGHFLTKSRRYSVTFRILRDARVIWRRTETGHEWAEQPVETTLIVGLLSYAGSGWRTTGDALLANTAAAMARERHEAAREEMTAAA